jgi:FkbM family methyltransferase
MSTYTCSKMVSLSKRLGFYNFLRELNNYRRRSGRLRFYSKFVRKGDLCFDIGANIGNRTEILLQLGAKVVAVEPQTTCVQSLRKKFGGYGNMIKIVQKAAAEKTGISKMRLCSSDGLSSMSKKWIEGLMHNGKFPKNVTWSPWQDVETTTLDELISSFGIPSFVKVDVEGYEPNVFKGLHRPILNISFEFTTETINDTFDIMDSLGHLGQYQYNYVLGEGTRFQLQKWVNREEAVTELSRLCQNWVFGDLYAHLISNQGS